MSIMKKGIQFAKNTIKKTVKFVKKNWKIIVLVGLGVFTAGLATIGGFAGFSAAMSAAGGGFGGFMSTVGSTMWAGVTSIGGSLGIGNGASGAAAAATKTTGMGLGGGLGWGSSGYGLGVTPTEFAANQVARGVGQAAITGPDVTTQGIAPPPTSTTVDPTAVGKAGSGTTTQQISNSVSKTPPTNTPPPPTGKPGWWDTGLAQAALVTTGGQMVAGYAAAKAAEEDDPLGFWGVDLTGKGNDVAPPTFQQAPAPQIEWFNSGAGGPTVIQAPLAPQITRYQSYQPQPYPQQSFQPQPTGLMGPVAPQVGG